MTLTRWLRSVLGDRPARNSQSVARLSIEHLEDRTVPAVLRLEGWQNWTFGAPNAYGTAYSPPPPQEGSSVGLSFAAGSWDYRWWGMPFEQENGSAEVDQGTIQITIRPSAGESNGDKVRVTISATTSAHWGNQYHVANVADEHSVETSVSGPLGEFLSFETTPNFTGTPSASGSQTFDTVIGQGVPLNFRLYANRPDGWPPDNIVGILNITVSVMKLKADAVADTLEWNAAKKGIDLTYAIQDIPSGKAPSPKIAFYWATGTTLESRLPGPAAHTVNLKMVEGTRTLFASGFKTPPKGATHLIAVLDSTKLLDESDEENNVVALEYKVDFVVKSVKWTPSKGGMGITYDLTGRALTADETAKVAVYWGQGGAPIGDPIYTTALDGKTGTGKKIQVPGGELKNAPDEADQLVVVLDSDEAIPESNEGNNTSTLADVTVTYKAGAKQVLTPYTIEVIKEALRFAGQKTGQVNSTYRTPRDQAEAMYNNIINGTSPSYKPPGQRVIKAYEDAHRAYKKAKKLNPSTPVPDYIAIMEAQIIAEGPEKVSLHCRKPEDYAQLQVVDFSYALTTNKILFHQAITSDSRIVKVLDPFNSSDPAFHIEVPQ